MTVDGERCLSGFFPMLPSPPPTFFYLSSVVYTYFPFLSLSCPLCFLSSVVPFLFLLCSSSLVFLPQVIVSSEFVTRSLYVSWQKKTEFIRSLPDQFSVGPTYSDQRIHGSSIILRNGPSKLAMFSSSQSGLTYGRWDFPSPPYPPKWLRISGSQQHQTP